LLLYIYNLHILLFFETFFILQRKSTSFISCVCGRGKPSPNEFLRIWKRRFNSGQADTIPHGARLLADRWCWNKGKCRKHPATIYCYPQCYMLSHQYAALQLIDYMLLHICDKKNIAFSNLRNVKSKYT